MNKHHEAHKVLLERSIGRYERLASLLESNGPLEVERRNSDELLRFLSRTVVGQQLSAKAARSIWLRIEELQQENDSSLEALFQESSVQRLRDCGVSRSKIKALIGISEASKTGVLVGEEVLELPYSALKKKITSIWGLGDWSADMCAMFFCGQPDVFPDTDAAIIQGIIRLCGEEQPPAEIAEHYAPYRTYLCRHIWLGLDSGYLD